VEERTNVECRSQAAEYEATSDEEARASQFEKYGIRWSELLRLPYFDIVRCVVVDTTHNLFLGLIKEHLTGILGISLQSRKARGPCYLNQFLGTSFGLHRQRKTKPSKVTPVAFGSYVAPFDRRS
jgi:hypothetical protein